MISPTPKRLAQVRRLALTRVLKRMEFLSDFMPAVRHVDVDEADSKAS
jgi:hypothetical protein